MSVHIQELPIEYPESRQVWVGCLACYNEGRLNGNWLDPEDGAEWGCSRGTPDDPHEETWVMDHEMFGSSLKGECSPSEALSIHEALTRVEENYSTPLRLVQAVQSDLGHDTVEEAATWCDDHVVGAGDSMLDILFEVHSDEAEKIDLPVNWDQVIADFFSEGGIAFRLGARVWAFTE